ncbi:MAG: DUF285 domain-containing protein, partial [Erysipelotrichaceae bacterium]|nr:DUF285 domain-containing protein [Erysipelotrichaceae bacterium]
MEKILNSSSSKVVSISSGNVIAEAVSDEYAFGTSIRKYNVNSITFLDGYDILPLDSEPNIYSHDISENGDGCVMLYADYSEGEMYHVYIVGEGGVDANPNSSKLFYDFKNCTSIDFNDCFYTSNVTTMIEMFYNCQELTELDLSSFDTSNVSDMSYMFYRCRSLTELDLSSFNTSNVT